MIPSYDYNKIRSLVSQLDIDPFSNDAGTVACSVMVLTPYRER
jgi:hypothetical protein